MSRVNDRTQSSSKLSWSLESTPTRRKREKMIIFQNSLELKKPVIFMGQLRFRSLITKRPFYL
jgi:hypothetical protein